MAQSVCIANIGDEYEIDNRLWKVTSIKDDMVVLRCSTKSVDAAEYTYFEFSAAVYEGDIKIPNFAADSIPLPDYRFSDLPQHVKQNIYRKNAYVKQYAVDKNSNAISTEESIASVASKLKDVGRPSTRSLERWYERWQQFEEHWMAFIPKKYLEHASTRVNPIVEEIMIEAIESLYLVRNSKHSLEGVCEDIENTLLKPEYAHLEEAVPSKSTIKRRLDHKYGRIEIVRRREGEEAAKRLEEVLGVPERPTRILQWVEIDETVLDCFIVDENGIPIGRPTLVLIVDVYSKMITGVYVTFQKPSAAVVLQAIKMSIRPKEPVIAGIDDIVGEWPCYGIPEGIRTDNIKHYLSVAFGEALFDLQIEQEQSRVRKPKGKASVERTFLTVNTGLLNTLPGYVEKIAERIIEAKLDPQKTAVLTLDEFREHLFRWVVNEQNYRQSERLDNRRPIDVWNESLALHKPRNNRSLESLDVSLLLTVTDRTIQATKGIAFNNTQYTNTELARLRARLLGRKDFKKNTQNPVVKFRWNPDNLGYIWVQDPETQKNIQVWTNDETYHGLSEQLYKCAKELKSKILKQDGKHITVKEAVVRTRRELAEMVGGKAKVADKKRLAAMTSKLDQKMLDEPYVKNGSDFASEINSGKHLPNNPESQQTELPEFKPSRYMGG